MEQVLINNAGIEVNQRPAIEAGEKKEPNETSVAGEAALRRLLPIAQGYGGTAKKVAGFLAGLYNGPEFPFDMTDRKSVV